MKINTSAFIELHIGAEPILLNVNLIETIKPSSFQGKAQIYTAGSEAGDYWIVEESYETVIEKIYEL